MNCDIVGDVHGCFDELIALLEQTGWKLDVDGLYVFEADPNRKLLFVGDLIDRGPKIRETVQFVRKMCQAGRAMTVMGNHEFNAVNFAEFGPNGYYRQHNIKNILQHSQTLKAFQNRQKEWNSYIEWFKTLPIYLDLPEFRIVHACWDDDLLKLCPTAHLQNSANWDLVRADGYTKELIEKCLKGQELDLPEGISFADKDGNVRTRARTKWWKDSRDLLIRDFVEQNVKMDSNEKVVNGNPGYSENAKPVFFGHYWLRGEPVVQTDNVCCLDYSVAKKGALVLYRWNRGDKRLSKERMLSYVVPK